MMECTQKATPANVRLRWIRIRRTMAILNI